jgi:hypothetical protein
MRWLPHSPQRGHTEHLPLIKVLEERGHRVAAGGDWKPVTSITIRGEVLSVALRERLEKTEDLPNKGHSILSFTHLPARRLTFRVHDLEGTGIRQSWSDGRRRTLDACLGKLVAGLEFAAEVKRERRLRRGEDRRRWEEQWAREQEAKRHRELEAARADCLRKLAADWRSAEEIRAFLRAWEVAVPQAQRNGETEEWLRWAGRVAAGLDPLADPSRIPSCLSPSASSDP